MDGMLESAGKVKLTASSFRTRKTAGTGPVFSLLWPVWLWYKNPLGADIAMMIYWISLGYVLSEPHLAKHPDARPVALPTTGAPLRERYQ